jgi:hypothetical protein
VVSGAETEWRLNLKSAAALPWPTPPCLTFFALDRFLFAWNDFVERAPETIIIGPDGSKLAVFVWIAAGTAAIRGDLPQTLSRDKPLPADWKKLFKTAAACIPDDKDRSPRASRHRDWLNGIAKFFMPELKVEGLPQPDDLIEFWKKQRLAIRRQRAEALAIIYNNLSPEVARLLRSEEVPEFFSAKTTWKPSWKFIEALAKNKPNPQDDDSNEDDGDPSASASTGTGTGGSARDKRKKNQSSA